MSELIFSHFGVNHKVRDFDRSKAFYDAFGFQKILEFGPDLAEKSKFRGLFYQIGNALLEISEGHMAVKSEVFQHPVQDSKVSLMIYVNSLIPVLDTCDLHGIEIQVEPREFPWGQIGFVVKDPDNLVIVFLSQATESERQRVQARTDVPLVRDEPDYSDDHVAAVQSRKRE